MLFIKGPSNSTSVCSYLILPVYRNTIVAYGRGESGNNKQKGSMKLVGIGSTSDRLRLLRPSLLSFP